MTTQQILWGVNSFLFIILFFFVKTWVNNLKSLIERAEINIGKKLDIAICEERHTRMVKVCDGLGKHKHAPISEGIGGEVILK